MPSECCKNLLGVNAKTFCMYTYSTEEVSHMEKRVFHPTSAVAGSPKEICYDFV